MNRPKRIELTPQDVRLTLAPAKDGEKPRRRFAMTAYTGDAFQRWWGSTVIDLAGLEIPKDGCPIFRQHDPTRFVGRTDSISLSRTLEIEGFFFNDVPEAAEVVAISDQGGRWQASVGLELDWDAIDEISEASSIEVNGRTFQGPVSVLRRARLLEASFVPLGADEATEAVALRKEESMPAPEKDKGEAVKEERERLKALRNAFPKDTDFALDAYDRGLSVIEAKAEYSDRLAKRLDEETEARKKVEAEAAEQKKKAEEAAKLAARPSPAAALGGRGGLETEPSDPIERFNSAVTAETARLKEEGSQGLRNRAIPLPLAINLRTQAIHNIAQRDPALVREFNLAMDKRAPARR